MEAERRRRRFPAVLLLTVIVTAWAAVTILSMRQTSATFDEIVLAAAGSHGYITGDFDHVWVYHPRLMPYIYGLPAVFAGARHPADSAVFSEEGGRSFGYARALFFQQGNDTEALVFRARLLAVMIGAGLIVLVFAFTRRYYGDVPAVMAACMTAFLPDVIAHAGIAYNDVPAAVALFGAVWALDRAAAEPAPREVFVAALLTGLALSVKYSAIALAPIAGVLLLLEARARGRQWQEYMRRVLRRVPLAVVTVYAFLVVMYLGDFMLTSYLQGLVFNVSHASGGHGVPTWLLGRASTDGFRYFYPVAFFIKTPVALHIMLALALFGLWTRRGSGSVLRSPLRGPLVAVAVFGVLLLSAGLNIGFRHALPVLPFVTVMGAVGLWRVWQARGTPVRVAIAGLILVQAVSVLSWYPHFIPYTSEYFPDRDRGYMRAADSTHDWGQGLPLLRRFMEEENVPVVYLSYFGSAEPEAYGIRYVPLRSYFALPPQPAPAEPPRYLAISATNLVGVYVDDDFAAWRDVEPYRVLGHNIFIFEID